MRTTYPHIYSDGTTVTIEARSMAEADAAAEEVLGAGWTAQSVRRVRRGGVGGFFATEVVELIAAPAASKRREDEALATAEDLLRQLQHDGGAFATRLIDRLAEPLTDERTIAHLLATEQVPRGDARQRPTFDEVRVGRRDDGVSPAEARVVAEPAVEAEAFDDLDITLDDEDLDIDLGEDATSFAPLADIDNGADSADIDNGADGADIDNGADIEDIDDAPKTGEIPIVGSGPLPPAAQAVAPPPTPSAPAVPPAPPLAPAVPLPPAPSPPPPPPPPPAITNAPDRLAPPASGAAPLAGPIVKELGAEPVALGDLVDDATVLALALGPHLSSSVDGETDAGTLPIEIPSFDEPVLADEPALEPITMELPEARVNPFAAADRDVPAPSPVQVVLPRVITRHDTVDDNNDTTASAVPASAAEPALRDLDEPARRIATAPPAAEPAPRDLDEPARRIATAPPAAEPAPRDLDEPSLRRPRLNVVRRSTRQDASLRDLIATGDAKGSRRDAIFGRTLARNEDAPDDATAAADRTPSDDGDEDQSAGVAIAAAAAAIVDLPNHVPSARPSAAPADTAPAPLTFRTLTDAATLAATSSVTVDDVTDGAKARVPASRDNGGGWSGPALRALGLPDGLVAAAAALDPRDDAEWTAALMLACRPRFAAVPRAPMLMAGPQVAAMASALRLPLVAAGEHVRAAFIALETEDPEEVAATIDGRDLHLVVGGAWQELARLRPAVVSAAGPRFMLPALSAAHGWDVPLGWMGGVSTVRLDAVTLALEIRAALGLDLEEVRHRIERAERAENAERAEHAERSGHSDRRHS